MAEGIASKSLHKKERTWGGEVSTRDEDNLHTELTQMTRANTVLHLGTLAEYHLRECAEQVVELRLVAAADSVRIDCGL